MLNAVRLINNYLLPSKMPKTLYDKLWEEHHITTLDSSESLLYIDRQYLHEVTSPQAFEGLSKKGLSPWRLNANIATPDHNVPTERGESVSYTHLTLPTNSLV